jgi:hypothetical protein
MLEIEGEIIRLSNFDKINLGPSKCTNNVSTTPWTFI